jgi:hypothetical protein
MLHGETRPNVVSWILWTLIQMIIIIAQFSAGASWSVILPIAMTFNTCLVLIICLYGYGYAKYGYVDLICLVLALAAIAAWRLTNDPVLAIVLSVAADFAAAVPTFVKTYREPFTESILSWAILVVANTCGLISAIPFNLANTAFAGYVVLFDGFFLIVMIMRRRIVRPRTS